MLIIDWIKRIVSKDSDKKVIVLIRGVAGSGKSTLAMTLSQGKYPVMAADDYFTDSDGNYKWDRNKLHIAHQDCQDRCKAAMVAGSKLIFVNNTFTKTKDMHPYIKMAQDHGYMLFSTVVEKLHDNANVHGVPDEALKRMADELMRNIKLK